MSNKTLITFAIIALMLCSCRNGKTEPTQVVAAATNAESFTGHFVDEYDGSSLTISAREDGRYDVLIDLFRLTYLYDGVGDDADGGIDFTATDAAGEPIGGRITIAADTATLTFVHTTWPLIEEGATWEFKRE